MSKHGWQLIHKIMCLFNERPEHVLEFYNTDARVEVRRVTFILVPVELILLSLTIYLGQVWLESLSLVFGLIFFVLYLNRYNFRYNTTMNIINEYSDLIFNELATVKAFSNSLIDAIRFIMQGNYPYISEELKVSLQRIELGASPEKEIQLLLSRYPADILKEGFSLFLENQYVKDENLEATQKLAQQIALNQYEEQTSQFETRIMIFVGLTLFLIPIYQLLSSFSEWGLSSILGFFLFIGMLTGLEHILFRQLRIGRLSTIK